MVSMDIAATVSRQYAKHRMERLLDEARLCSTPTSNLYGGHSVEDHYRQFPSRYVIRVTTEADGSVS
jgi:hypothetical protein